MEFGGGEEELMRSGWRNGSHGCLYVASFFREKNLR